MFKDSSDAEQNDQHKSSPVMQHRNIKLPTRLGKKTQSGPSSPSQHFEFFGKYFSINKIAFTFFLNYFYLLLSEFNYNFSILNIFITCYRHKIQ